MAKSPLLRRRPLARITCHTAAMPHLKPAMLTKLEVGPIPDTDPTYAQST